MFKQLPTADANVLAVEITDGYTKGDVKAFEQAFESVLATGVSRVNVLVKMDQMSLAETDMTAVFEDLRYCLKHLDQLRHVAVITGSSFVDMIVSVDNFFLGDRAGDRIEKAFTPDEIDHAWLFMRS